MTETNGLTASNAGADLRTHPTSCGRALSPLVSVRVVDSDGNVLPAGETGELCISGPMLFTEYWNRPADTAAAVRDGWLHTGDLGHVDEDGFIFITGRAKEMIIRGGENIGCQEVEEAIYDHPNVVECVVFGVPDERLGENVAAVVRVKGGAILTAGDVRSHVAVKLARFKIPAYIAIRESELPRIASGKIDKRTIRDELMTEFQISS